MIVRFGHKKIPAKFGDLVEKKTGPAGGGALHSMLNGFQLRCRWKIDFC